jgi:hypothetical protein
MSAMPAPLDAAADAIGRLLASVPPAQQPATLTRLLRRAAVQAERAKRTGAAPIEEERPLDLPVEIARHPAPPSEDGRRYLRLEAIGRSLGAEIRSLRPDERPEALRRALAAAAEVGRPDAAPRPEAGDRLRLCTRWVRRGEPW